MKMNNNDTRWLRLTDRSVGRNEWLWTWPELWFGGAALISIGIGYLLELCR